MNVRRSPVSSSTHLQAVTFLYLLLCVQVAPAVQDADRLLFMRYLYEEHKGNAELAGRRALMC
jgi:hypothetical protein